MDIDRFHFYWKETQWFAVILIFVVFTGFFIGLVFSNWLNHIRLFGFPLGLLLLGQALIVFIIGLMFWFVGRQSRLDEMHGADEDL